MYTIDEFDLVRIGRNGMGSINVKVVGFWSGSSLTLYVNRRFGAKAEDTEWTFTLSTSSGGRDTKEVEDDMVAYKNYSAALAALCDLGTTLKMNTAKMEAAYQVQRAADRQEREAEKAAQAAAVEADKPMGEVLATILVEEMALTGAYAHAFNRAEDRPFLVEVARREKTKYYFGGSIMAKKALIAKLAGMSTRSRIPAELKAA